MRRVAWLGLIAIAVLGCKRTNELYCDETTPCATGVCDVATNECTDAVDIIDAGAPDAPECLASSDCDEPASPICDPASLGCRTCEAAGECAARDPASPQCADDGRCVECTGPTHCAAAQAPICRDDACSPCASAAECMALDAAAPVCAPTGACVECYDHGDCASGVCDRDAQVCVDAAAVMYVDGTSGSDDAGCGASDAPCQTIDFALDEVTEGRAILSIAAGTYVETDLLIDGQDATLIGPAAALESVNADAAVLEIKGAADVLIDGLTIRNAEGGVTADGMRCSEADTVVRLQRVTVTNNAADGIDAQSGCALTLEDSAVTRNLLRGISSNEGTLTLRRSTVRKNDAGGVRVQNSPFTIVNNFIVANGSLSGGGSTIGGLSLNHDSAMSPAVFEFNTVAENQVGDLAQASGVVCRAETTVANNIVYDGVGEVAVAGTCTWAYSDIEGGAPGATNIDAAPQFVDIGSFNYHLQPGSPARDAADPAATVAVDIDGDARPQGARADIGADEVVE